MGRRSGEALLNVINTRRKIGSVRLETNLIVRASAAGVRADERR
jgi:DNA-binding LacI/PurR family transcriptional regulator